MELINALVSKLYHLLQVMLFCSIMQQSMELINVLFSKLYHLLQVMLFCSILQQPDNFYEKETRLNLCLMTNYPRVSSLELINELVSKLYRLLQIMLFCSNLQQPDISKMRPIWITSI